MASPDDRGDPPVAWWLTDQPGWEAAGAGRATAPMPASGRDLRDELRAFTQVVRRHGIPIPTDRLVTFLEAAAVLAPPDLVDVYWAGRATLVTDPADRGAYDRAFLAHFVGAGREQVEAEDAVEPHTVWVDRPADADETGDEDDEPQPGAVASIDEHLRHRRFDRATEDELAAMHRLMARIEVALPQRRHRRTFASRRGRRLDLGRSLRHAVHTDGEVVQRIWRRRRRHRRPLVLLLDVSGSMADYSRALMQFAFSATMKAEHIEVFAFGTRLTRLTPDLDAGDVDRALRAAADRVVDWDSGTRIGASLDRLHRRWGRRGILRGAVVVVVSDGLERGDVELLRSSMQRLQRQAHAVVWVNPLKADPRYEPLARGMAAALPSIDRFLTGHDVASLDALADVIADL